MFNTCFDFSQFLLAEEGSKTIANENIEKNVWDDSSVGAMRNKSCIGVDS